MAPLEAQRQRRGVEEPDDLLGDGVERRLAKVDRLLGGYTALCLGVGVGVGVEVGVAHGRRGEARGQAGHHPRQGSP